MAESDGLENRCGRTPTVGSNPTPSATATTTMESLRKVGLRTLRNPALRMASGRFRSQRPGRGRRHHGVAALDSFDSLLSSPERPG